MSDSDSDDDMPIAQRTKKKQESSDEDSDSESSSDDDMPIAQTISKQNNNKNKNNNTIANKINLTAGLSSSESDSEDDKPLIRKFNKKISINSPNNSKSVSSMSTSSSSSPIIKRTSKTIRNNNNNNNNNNQIKKKRKPISRKRHKRFADSDDDDDDTSSSDDDRPISTLKAATIQSPARKKRKSLDGSPIRSGSSSYSNNNNNNNNNSFTTKRKKKGSTSAPGYIGRECNPVHLYTVKSSLKPLKAKKGAVKWWEEKDDNVVSYQKKDDSKSKIKWNTLDHNGIVFAPPYVAHGIPVKYNNIPIKLTPDQEEIATMYGVMIETDWAQKPKFRQNFMKEFKKILRDKKQAAQFPQIDDLDQCDFRDIYNWYQNKKEAEKLKKKDPVYKEKIKKEKEKYDSLYGWALVDGILEKLGNYKVEPPGLFRGRGEHPKMGQLKKRILPENIILNIGENTPIPKCPLSNHNWGGIIHDKTVTYIAKWVENINGQHKFVYLSASSRFKGQNDRNKYEKARVLKSKINKIRKDYESKLTSPSLMSKQLSTALYFIDKLSIRVGNEKDTDEEADTVGVCSLRKEHITLLEPEKIITKNNNNNNNNDNSDSDDEDDDIPINELSSSTKYLYKITLDFLGKDSMRYHQTVSVTKQIHKNLKIFLAGKGDDMDIFEKIDPNKVNQYLSDQMDGLTAKVFRTHNASTTLQKELSSSYHAQIGKLTKKSPLSDKIFFYNQCNKQVAILCNHQRSVSKSHAEQLEKMDKQIKDIKDIISELKEELLIATGKKKASKRSKKNKNNSPKKKRSVDQIRKLLQNKKDQLHKKQLQKALKEDNKEVALGTSKINYMDPRITVSWCKQMDVPIEKIFNKSLLDKFPWAMQSMTEYIF